MSLFADLDGLLAAARGGRVAHSGFLLPDEASRLRRAVLEAGLGVTVGGGFVGARRRVVTAHASHVPEAAPSITALYLPGVTAERASGAFVAERVDPRWLGDVVAHQDGVSVVTLDPPEPGVLDAAGEVVGGSRVSDSVERVPLERVAGGTLRREQVVVPSLRVDAIGAKGFRTSRTWFTKGIAAGNVRLNGDRADKGAEAVPGDEIWAEGLGWIRVESVEGETRRGNLKAVLAVEKT